MSRVRMIVAICSAVVAVIAIALWKGQRGRTAPAEPHPSAGAPLAAPRVAATKPETGRPGKGSESAAPLRQAPGTPDAPGDAVVEVDIKADMELADQVHEVLEPFQDKLNSDDPGEILSAARAIMRHKLSDVRMRAVEALANGGKEGLRELLSMVDDGDEDVAEYARDQLGLELHMMDSSNDKTTLLRDYGDEALKLGADEFGELFDLVAAEDDRVALDLLAYWAEKTSDREILSSIYDEINIRVNPDKEVTGKADIPAALAEFQKQQAEEEAAEKALDAALGITVEKLD